MRPRNPTPEVVQTVGVGSPPSCSLFLSGCFCLPASARLLPSDFFCRTATVPHRLVPPRVVVALAPRVAAIRARIGRGVSPSRLQAIYHLKRLVGRPRARWRPHDDDGAVAAKHRLWVARPGRGCASWENASAREPTRTARHGRCSTCRAHVRLCPSRVLQGPRRLCRSGSGCACAWCWGRC